MNVRIIPAETFHSIQQMTFSYRRTISCICCTLDKTLFMNILQDQLTCSLMISLAGTRHDSVGVLTACSSSFQLSSKLEKATNTGMQTDVFLLETAYHSVHQLVCKGNLLQLMASIMQHDCMHQHSS